MAPAKKFGLRRKFSAQTYAILLRIKICRDLRTFWRSLGKKSAFLGQKQCFQCFLGKKCTITFSLPFLLPRKGCQVLPPWSSRMHLLGKGYETNKQNSNIAQGTLIMFYWHVLLILTFCNLILETKYDWRVDNF